MMSGIFQFHTLEKNKTPYTHTIDKRSTIFPEYTKKIKKLTIDIQIH
jgi:hypothetical protein